MERIEIMIRPEYGRSRALAEQAGYRFEGVSAPSSRSRAGAATSRCARSCAASCS